jgi:hypothetical protein
MLHFDQPGRGAGGQACFEPTHRTALPHSIHADEKLPREYSYSRVSTIALRQTASAISWEEQVTDSCQDPWLTISSTAPYRS